MSMLSLDDADRDVRKFLDGVERGSDTFRLELLALANALSMINKPCKITIYTTDPLLISALSVKLDENELSEIIKLNFDILSSIENLSKGHEINYKRQASPFMDQLYEKLNNKIKELVAINELDFEQSLEFSTEDEAYVYLDDNEITDYVMEYTNFGTKIRFNTKSITDNSSLSEVNDIKTSEEKISEEASLANYIVYAIGDSGNQVFVSKDSKQRYTNKETEAKKFTQESAEITAKSMNKYHGLRWMTTKIR